MIKEEYKKPEILSETLEIGVYGNYGCPTPVPVGAGQSQGCCLDAGGEGQE